MGCKTQYGISLVCGDLLYPAGLHKDFWVGYLSELSSQISLTQTGDIASLSFSAYGGLRKFEGVKYAHMGNWEISKGPGGNLGFIQRFIAKLVPRSTQDDVEIQRLAQSNDAFVLYKDNDDKFFIAGAGKGLQSAAGPLGSTGQNPGDDISTTVTLEGIEKTLPLRFSGTQAIVDGYVI